MSEQMAFGLLPDLDGYVHGIVQMEPHIRIQCDGCGHIHDGEPGKAAFAVLTCDIVFSPRRYHAIRQRDTRRLCRDCRRTEWDDNTAEEASRDRAE